DHAPDALRDAGLRGHGQPDRPGRRPLGAALAGARSGRAAGVPPALLRDAALSRVRAPGPHRAARRAAVRGRSLVERRPDAEDLLRLGDCVLERLELHADARLDAMELRSLPRDL